MAERGGFFKRLFSSKKGSFEEPPKPSAEEKAEHAIREDPTEKPADSDLEAVVGGSPDAQLAAFSRLRRTADEARAIDALLARDREAPLRDDLALHVASALVDRGEPARASILLEPRSSAAALLLRSDLEADRGDLHRALALVERVAFSDLDFPGARERLVRHRATLGIVPPASPSSANATIVGPRETDAPFVLLREVARGGAGAVYEAEDRELGRRVALKIYHDDHRSHAQLAHEARVAAELAGAGVVRVYDVDLEHAWLAIEWAHGGSLRDAIRSKNSAVVYPLEKWAVPLARALARVHAKGWAHLDVKPANVLFDARGASMLGDFGIAQKIGAAAAPGSMGFVSPERMAGEPASAQDDVYGFGRVLEEALALQGDAPWRKVAAACLAGKAARPANGAALEACIMQLIPVK